MPGIGATLREARMRAHIDVSEIEAQTKIRAKYLRALENEEWDLLPGPTFVKSFLRTYANALGLDSRQVLEDYREAHELPNEPEVQPIAPLGRRRGRVGPRPGGGRGFVIAVAIFSLIIVLLVVALLTGGSSNAPITTPSAKAPAGPHRHPHQGAGAAHPTPNVATLQLRPTAPVYVCLLGSGGRKLINGVIIQPGRPQPVYRSARFEMTLGNSALSLRVNGRTRTVAPSASAFGFVITPRGQHSLAPAQLPTCR
jgi:helix-turn-helix protein